MTAATISNSRFCRYAAAEVAYLLVSCIPWFFVMTLPVYIIRATQLYFFNKSLWLKVFASAGPFLLWLVLIYVYKSSKTL